MKTVNIDTSHQGADAKELLGYNLLNGVTPELIDFGGEAPITKNIKAKISDVAYMDVVGEYDDATHIDILADNCTMTYDLGEGYQIDTIFTAGYWSGKSSRFMFLDYELHVSETREELYTESSLITRVNNKELVAADGPRASEAFFNIEGVSGRFFGFKVNKACTFDDIIRMTYIGVYNNEISHRRCFIEKSFDKNLLTARDIEITTSFAGEVSALVNGNVFEKSDAVALENGEIILNCQSPVRNVTLIGEFEDFAVFTADNADELWSSAAVGEVTEYPTNTPETCKILKLAENSKKLIGIRVKGKATLEQIVLNSRYREATVDLDKVKTKDFIGIGANDIPTAWMTESRIKGFRNVYWPIYRHRMEKSKPAALRVWFQVDWVVDNEEDYMAGKCNFQSDKMRAVLKYLDAYEAAGIEIEFNFGWKAGTIIQDWFCLKEVNDALNRKEFPSNGLDRRGSAPRNFVGFAKCCAATVKELCETRGYTCIKHLTFYNEANYGDNSLNVGDFMGYKGKSKEMWEVMLRAVDKELKAVGADKYVDFWLAEESGTAEIELEWIDFMMKNCCEFNALNTFHRYEMNYNDRLEYFNQVVEHAGEVGAFASEFAVYADPRWDRSNVEYVMSMLHSGLRGGLYWILQGVMLTDPSWLYLNGDTEWWSAPYHEEATATDNKSYHDFTLFTHYLPRHSKVLETTNLNEDIRVEVIETKNGEYTVFVESREGKNPKDINIKLGKTLNTTFRKHVYKRDEIIRDGNLRVPSVVKEIEVGSTLCDTLDAEYQLACYTTIPAFRQVNMKEVFVELPLGDSHKIETELFDCNGELTYEIVSATGVECRVDENGVFTQGEGVIRGDKYCVKAALKDHPETYGIALIKIM